MSGDGRLLPIIDMRLDQIAAGSAGVERHGRAVQNNWRHECSPCCIEASLELQLSVQESKRKINPTPALRRNLCASGVGIPLPLTDQENLGYDLIRKGWENGSQRLTRRAVEISRARSTGQIRESGYVERKGDRDVPCFFGSAGTVPAGGPFAGKRRSGNQPWCGGVVGAGMIVTFPGSSASICSTLLALGNSVNTWRR